jgi:TolA-binding protein
MKYLQTIIALCIASNVGLYAEPSVYGNSSSFATPQKVINQNRQTIATLQRQLAQQNEHIEGLKSIVEGLSATVHQLGQAPRNAQGTGAETALLQDLGTMIDKINANYVTKEELQSALGNKKIKNKPIPKPVTVNTNNNSELYSEGVRLFVKQRFDEAKKRFTQTDTKGYKIAPSNYYLGEIAYYTKQYENAIFYFKKSAGINDKASYIDTLLLHTAISLENRGEPAQAKAFYENIISNYAGKKTASIAREKLKKL